MADIEADDSANPPPDIAREQARIARADAICIVFPLFWWGMPSMIKGWVDRVWTWGWAYDQLDDPELSLQKPRSGVLPIPAGARSEEIEAEGFLQRWKPRGSRARLDISDFLPANWNCSAARRDRQNGERHFWTEAIRWG